MTINEMLCFVEKIIKRPLAKEEVLMLGIAYNEGLREGGNNHGKS